LAVDSSGRVRDARLTGLSRYQSLNQQSLRLARQRWQFAPATRDGEPVDGTVRVKFTWRLPLEPVREFRVTSSAVPESADRADFRCYPQPIDFDQRDAIPVTDSATGGPPVTKRYERWTYVDAKGVATN